RARATLQVRSVKRDRIGRVSLLPSYCQLFLVSRGSFAYTIPWPKGSIAVSEGQGAHHAASRRLPGIVLPPRCPRLLSTGEAGRCRLPARLDRGPEPRSRGWVRDPGRSGGRLRGGHLGRGELPEERTAALADRTLGRQGVER